MNRVRSLISPTAFLLLAVPCAGAAVSFNDEVRPLLNKHCIACHGGVKKAGEISWLFREDALKKGKSGEYALVPGKPEASNMLRRIVDHDDPMPPPEHGPMLSAAEVDMLTRWVAEGAVWEGHWAFEKPVRPDIPAVKDRGWPRGEIDALLLARMESEGLRPEAEQDRARLIRRVTLDLTGLPPSPEEVGKFVSDASPQAMEALVDQLLATPQFGERWAAMWLDAVRYADSKGLGQDANRDMWKFRDWVIDAFNADMPFDQFTIRQLAGDLLPDATIEDRIATACHRATATNDEGGTDDEEFRIEALIDRVSTTWQTWQGVTFGCVQCHSHPYDPFRHEEFYQFAAFLNQTRDVDTGADYPFVMVPMEKADYPAADRLDREIGQLRRSLHQPAAALAGAPGVWTGLTDLQAGASGCGAEVVTAGAGGGQGYQLTGTVPRGVRVTLEAPVPAGLTELTALRVDALPVDAEAARTLSEWGFVLSRLTVDLVPADGGKPVRVNLDRAFSDEPDPFLDPEDSLADKKSGGFAAYTRLTGPRWGVFLTEKPVPLAPGTKVRVSLVFSQDAQGAFPLVIRRGAVSLSGDPRWTALRQSPDQAAGRKALADAQRKRRALKAVKLPVMEDLEPGLRRTMQLFVRGNWMTRGDETPPGVPHIFPQLPSGETPDRLAMARWLVSPDQPLTARVMVNRLWEQLFGTGLVETLEDFGSAGERPSHPELLDWLAVHFREDLHWSMKGMLRELVLSAAYRQDNRVDPDKLARDPGNRLLARGPRLRLTAEMIRDQALAVSGLLTDQLHGAPAHPPLPQGVWDPFIGGEKWPVPKKGDPQRYRRALYTQVKRSIPYPMAATFDAPSRELCSQRRVPSNTPVQALALMNDEVFDEAAAALSARMLAAAGGATGRIAAGYRMVTGRAPDAVTAARLLRLLADSGAAGAEASAAWKNVAIVLLNLDEVITR